jgi:hypothetical protein
VGQAAKSTNYPPPAAAGKLPAGCAEMTKVAAARRIAKSKGRMVCGPRREGFDREERQYQ